MKLDKALRYAVFLGKSKNSFLFQLWSRHGNHNETYERI